jgi:L-asparaginase
MNGSIHAARDVEKTNTTNVDAFGSPERGPQGLVHTGKVSWFDPSTKRHTSKSEFSVEDLDKLPRVDIIYAYSNMPTDLIETAVRDGAKGLVIAGVGDGNMTKEALASLEKSAKSKGVLVVRSTRLGTGPVLRNAEVNDDKSGTVASGEFNPAKSRVLAQLALTETNDPTRVQKMFYTY